jgi:hypothetical protein
MSVISKELVDMHHLPCRPYDGLSKTASGTNVKCSMIAMFTMSFFIKDMWTTIACEAMVWEKTAKPLLISNKLALSTGLIDFTQPNEIRIDYFGEYCFSLNCLELIAVQHDLCAAIYAEDIMTPELEELCDLSQVLTWGQQDASTLPADAQVYAKRFPNMLKPIPEHADKRLKLWRAHIVEGNIATYAWPVADLRDLKEIPLPYKSNPLLHAEIDKLKAQFFVEELREMPSAVCMRIQLVNKSKTEKRFTINGSVQKKVTQVGVFPMPNIRQIFDLVASFRYRAKIDWKGGYCNFEVHPVRSSVV